jgi:hypothetical protein
MFQGISDGDEAGIFKIVQFSMKKISRRIIFLASNSVNHTSITARIFAFSKQRASSQRFFIQTLTKI